MIHICVCCFRLHYEPVEVSAGAWDDMELMRLMGASEFVGFLATIGVPVTEYGNADKGSKPLVELWLELVFRQCRLQIKQVHQDLSTAISFYLFFIETPCGV